MKQRFLISMVILIVSGISLKGQSVIASAGNFNSVTGLSISWTLGETIVPTFTSQDGTLILTHGFQQKLIITAVTEIPENLGKVKIYPNPSSAVIDIQFENPTDNEILLYLFDSQGKLVKTDRIEESVLDKNINLEDLPAGIYYLRMTKGNSVNVYKVVKL